MIGDCSIREYQCAYCYNLVSLFSFKIFGYFKRSYKLRSFLLINSYANKSIIENTVIISLFLSIHEYLGLQDNLTRKLTSVHI